MALLMAGIFWRLDMVLFFSIEGFIPFSKFTLQKLTWSKRSSFLVFIYFSIYMLRVINGLICRGSCQPYCRSLPDDPFLECFEFTQESNVQGLWFLLTMGLIHRHETWYLEKWILLLSMLVEVANCTAPWEENLIWLTLLTM